MHAAHQQILTRRRAVMPYGPPLLPKIVLGDGNFAVQCLYVRDSLISRPIIRVFSNQIPVDKCAVSVRSGLMTRTPYQSSIQQSYFYRQSVDILWRIRVESAERGSGLETSPDLRAD